MIVLILLLLFAYVKAQISPDSIYVFQATTTCPEDTAIGNAEECINAAEYALDYSQVVKTGDYAPYGVATSYDGGMPEGCHVWDTNPPNMWVRFQGYDGLNVDPAWGTLCSWRDSAFDFVTYQTQSTGFDCSTLEVSGTQYANTVDYTFCDGAGASDVCCAVFVQTTPTIAPTVDILPLVGPRQCLSQENGIAVGNDDTYFSFDGVAYNSNEPIGLLEGTYQLTGVTFDHPIGFEIPNPSMMSVAAGTGGTYILTDNGIDYYIGTVIITVHGDFHQASYRCWRHGYMGGEGHLVYDRDCVTPSPTLNPTHSPTVSPTKDPTTSPTSLPTTRPTTSPTTSPSHDTLCCEYDQCFDDQDDDGIPDYIETFTEDTDGDGILDYLDDDDDNDSVLTSAEHGGDGFNAHNIDCDGDGVPDHLDPDDDGDGVLTIIEVGGDVSNPTDASSLTDTDGDGNPDKCDIDDDGDGLLTIDEAGGLPVDGYLKHIEQRSCSTGGTIVDDSLCAAAAQANRRLMIQNGGGSVRIDLRPLR